MINERKIERKRKYSLGKNEEENNERKKSTKR